jgi:hypothetical protein
VDPGSAAHRKSAALHDHAALTKGGSVGRISANATWMIPAARPNATPIRQASV